MLPFYARRRTTSESTVISSEGLPPFEDYQMTTLLLFAMIGLWPAQETPRDKPKVPKDSIELAITGCLTGNVLAVSDVRRPDTESGPPVRAKSFRLAAKGDVKDDVKREDHHLVEVTGLVRKSALMEPGIKIGRRVTVGGSNPVAGSTGERPAPPEMIPVMDVWSVRLRSSSCSG
ncbi:MAG: hypothetical protein V7647_36 [Acidobacteriota bacterium]|jgi:hypothetical protein